MSKKPTTEKHLSLFNDFNIRRHFDKTQQKWFFSVIDIVAILTEQKDYKKAKSYWTTLKSRLNKEESQVVTNCDHLKMLAQDGKMRLLDRAYQQKTYLNFLAEKFNFSKLLAPIATKNQAVKRFEQLGQIIIADDKTLPVF